MATLADDLIGNLLNAGGLIGKSFAEGRQNNLVEQQGQQQLQIGNMRIAAAKSADEQAQQYQQDIAAYSANPTPEARAQLLFKHPDQAEAIKAGYAAMDGPVKESRLDQLYSLYSTADRNRPDLAANILDGTIAAEKNAGHDTSEAESIRDALKSPDDATRKQAMTQLKAFAGGHIAIVDPERAKALGLLPDNANHFAQFGSGGIYDERTGSIVRAPEDKPEYRTIKTVDENGNPVEQIVQVGKGGGQSSGGAGGGSMSPAAASVASALAGSGLPAPVVAGFMGNFHAEGGYDGAHGDGGSASGIGQWRGERAANFERVIGKPVTAATPEEQAKFVNWELQNPQAAGMTVKQRDAILAAKTPAQAAALIDQFYERSSGRDRKVRMDAATAFAGDSRPSGSGAQVVFTGKAAAGGNIGGLTPEALDYAASMALQNGGKIPPGFARNKAAQVALENAVAKKAADLGLDAKDVIAAGQNTNAAAKGVIAFSVGKQGDTVRSINVAVDHLAQLHDAAMALKNGNIPLFNRISQAWQQGTGSPLPTDATAIRGIVADEVSKAVLGSNGAVSDRADLHQNLSVAGSPQQIQGVIGRYISLMGGQARGLQRQYEQSTGRKDFNRFLAPNTVHALGMTHDAPIPTLTPAQAAKAPPGTMFRTTDGRTMKKR